MTKAQHTTSTSKRTATKKIAAVLLATSIAAGICLAATTGSAGSAGSAGSTSSQSAGPRDGATSPNNPTGQRNPNATTESSSGTERTGNDRTMGDKASAGVVDSTMIHRPGQALAGTDTGTWFSWDDFMTFVVQDVSSVWNWYYQQWGYSQSTVKYYWSTPGEVVYSKCGGDPLTDDSSPFYCGADDTIYFSQVRAKWYWDNAGGDFGVVTSIAHEYGHNVQAELGIKGTAGKSGNFEQQADCFSGAFAHVAYFQGILDANDVQEGLNSRYMVGDDGTGPDPHGTPQERADAFWLGYNASGPAACDAILTK